MDFKKYRVLKNIPEFSDFGKKYKAQKIGATIKMERNMARNFVMAKILKEID